MRRGFAALVLLSGLAFIGLGARVALFGAAPPVPSGEGVVEGEVRAGEAVPSPVGAPFLYGRLTIGHAATAESRGTLARVERDFGHPRVTVEAEGGARELELPRPDAWHVVPTVEGSAVIERLDALPLLRPDEIEQIGRTLPPPYEVTVRAIRPGDHLIAAAPGRAVESVYVGERAALEAQHEAEEAMRWPAVLLLVTVGLGSVALAALLLRGPREDAPEGDGAPRAGAGEGDRSA
jgi:hypothetical protein